ncbi:MAG: NYN domain-containing protein [Candidatus Protochlamydia sp.]|nr:NYN domain-containing protein [Candidatus Protochlamydia sp.]
MHYYIDGYNLLFRQVHAHDHLQNSREQLIQEINKKAALLNLDITIVFDSTFQISTGSRTHFQNIEILFTDHGETADELILTLLKNTRHPAQETVVTSDKRLASEARRCQAHTENVDSFIQRINKVYKKKLNKKNALLNDIKGSSAPPFPSSPPPPLSPEEGIQNDYERIFEANYQELIKNEPVKQTKEIIMSPKKMRRQNPFQEDASSAVDAPTQMERWLKAFEERSKENLD